MNHITELQTRYCESDALGHINSVSYFIYLEQARVNFILDSKIISNIKDWPFVLASIRCDLKRQIYINDFLLIKSFISEINQSSFKLEHEIYNKDSHELLAVGSVVIVHFNFDEQKSVVLSSDMRKKLKEFKK
ncbi:acyl-CoA thioesterase [Halalkalibacter krulwichiae]|uniref:Long-chain acyl-CoA thioesterase FadM n=1 Tax=Halalkalibacter krulwichiae TaxID=199441 RepID=A0A1X9MAU8_9BACI|nr:thioesterase family protein [Halalkalibacter krulwichiae]ARK29720.1 Long-chain acyl-CoA thioesterase FadM [Halalkalibacter krulwichiae]